MIKFTILKNYYNKHYVSVPPGCKFNWNKNYLNLQLLGTSVMVFHDKIIWSKKTYTEYMWHLLVSTQVKGHVRRKQCFAYLPSVLLASSCILLVWYSFTVITMSLSLQHRLKSSSSLKILQVFNRRWKLLIHLALYLGFTRLLTFFIVDVIHLLQLAFWTNLEVS